MRQLWHVNYGPHNGADVPACPQDLVKLKEKVMVCERVLMHTISFDLSVEHPYTYLVKLLKMVQGSSPNPTVSAH